MTESADDRDLHTALVSSRAGRVVVAVIVAIVSFWIVAPNLPDSAVRSRIDGWWTPADKIGLAQDWAVFSPNPRSLSIDVRARIEYADGNVEFWDVPDFDPLVGALRQYRWHKWQERLRLDANRRLWEPAAAWIAEQYERDGEPPVRVVLIRRWIDHQPLRNDGVIDDGGWNEFEFHTWESD